MLSLGFFENQKTRKKKKKIRESENPKIREFPFCGKKKKKPENQKPENQKKKKKKKSENPKIRKSENSRFVEKEK